MLRKYHYIKFRNYIIIHKRETYKYYFKIKPYSDHQIPSKTFFWALQKKNLCVHYPKCQLLLLKKKEFFFYFMRAITR